MELQQRCKVNKGPTQWKWKKKTKFVRGRQWKTISSLSGTVNHKKCTL